MKLKLLLATLLLPVFSLNSYAQNASDTTDLSATAKLLLNHTYLFTATYVQPMTGRERNITGDNYTLIITKDMLQAHLPYFGKANSAPIDATDVGMKFTSKDFTYQSNTLTKAREQITIQPKDVSDVQQIYLMVYPDGTADLHINSNSRQAIAYRGSISALKPAK